VQSTALTLRMGRIEIRDALDATDALLGARNALTDALVDYRIARYELARDMGLLRLDPSGPDGIRVLDPPAEIRG
jgi:outer membrane protein TolC